MKAVIFCAGLGIRLRPLTNEIPKPLIPVKGIPILDRLINYLASYEVTDIIVNLHYKPEKIMERYGTRLLYFYEPELLGERNTLLTLRNWFNDWVVTLNGDTLTNLNLRFLKAMAEKENSSIQSFDKGIYTGITIYNPNSPMIIQREFGCWWQDIGTPEGLKKAEEHYAQTVSELSQL